MDIYILIETRNCETEEISRHYFRNRSDAVAKARAMMDESMPKKRKTRQNDINNAVKELDEESFTDNTALYSEYRIERATLH